MTGRRLTPLPERYSSAAFWPNLLRRAERAHKAAATKSGTSCEVERNEVALDRLPSAQAEVNPLASAGRRGCGAIRSATPGEAARRLAPTCEVASASRPERSRQNVHPSVGNGKGMHRWCKNRWMPPAGHVPKRVRFKLPVPIR